jgi:SpoVK/Ycf46/Vps4 family AAA+-type ATPase
MSVKVTMLNSFVTLHIGWDAGEGGNSVNERLLSTLLNEMDGVEGRQGVFVIGCTNRPDQIDDAILRPG